MKRRYRRWPAAAAILIILVTVFIVVFNSRDSKEVFLSVVPYPRTVVIDAGHGGEDGGAKSPSGILESGINLEIAKKTDTLMRFYGINTVMVRTEDISIHDSGSETLAQKKRSDLNNRVRLVNSTPDAVLLSIHQNTFTDSKYFGAQVFFNNKVSAASLALKLQEQFIRLDPENKRLAKPVADSIFLMNNVNCPAVLAECGFLTNPKDERNLLSAGYQTKVAMVLLSAYTLWEV